MLTKYFIILTLLTLTLVSCDPAIGVAIVNNSKTDKNIRVEYPPHTRLPLYGRDTTTDSLKTYDLSLKDRYMHPGKIPILSMDTLKRTYSFNLKAGQEAFVESRFLATHPTYGQVFIIDNTDTVELKKKGKDFVKKPKLSMGGTWKYTITDDKP